jgi:hypothetical protein
LLHKVQRGRIGRQHVPGRPNAEGPEVHRRGRPPLKPGRDLGVCRKPTDYGDGDCSRGWRFQLPVDELLFSSEVLTNGLSKQAVLRVPVRSLGLVIGALLVKHIHNY